LLATVDQSLSAGGNGELWASLSAAAEEEKAEKREGAEAEGRLEHSSHHGFVQDGEENKIRRGSSPGGFSHAGRISPHKYKSAQRGSSSRWVAALLYAGREG
jgi:hypothetical protein